MQRRLGLCFGVQLSDKIRARDTSQTIAREKRRAAGHKLIESVSVKAEIVN